MEIILNGKNTAVPTGCTTLSRLVELSGKPLVTLHVTVDGREVPVTALHDVTLYPGQVINIQP